MHDNTILAAILAFACACSSYATADEPVTPAERATDKRPPVVLTDAAARAAPQRNPDRRA